MHSAPPHSGRIVLVVVTLALLIAVAHSPLRHGEYVQDDELAVERNEIVARGGVGEIFSTTYWEGARGADRTLFRPIVIGSYALEQRLTAEPVAAVSRSVNVLLHLLVTLGMMALARRTGFRAEAVLATAALFAVHPIHVEAVANVVGRAELLAALFSLLALWALTHAIPWRGQDPEHPRIAAWVSALGLFLALGSKEIAIATPFLMAGLVAIFAPSGWLRDRRIWIDRAAALAPGALATLVYMVLRIRALEVLVSLQRVHPLDNLLVDLHGTERLATALGLAAKYAGLLLYPTTLAIDYSGSVIDTEPGLLGAAPLLGALFLLAVSAPAVLRMLRGANASAQAALAAVLFCIPYAVIGNLFFDVGAAFAERFMYMPSIGFCMLAGLSLTFLSSRMEAPRGPRVLSGILALVVLSFTLQTFSRCLEWRDNRTIFEAAARANPESPRAHFVLGKLTLDEGDPASAIEYFDRVLELRPDHPTAWMEKGNAYAAQGRFGEAERMFRETLRWVPNYATAHRNLALALRRQGRLREAEASLRKAALWNPNSATTWAEMGNLRLQQRRFRGAAEAYRQAIALGRDDLAPRLALAEREAGVSP